MEIFIGLEFQTHIKAEGWFSAYGCVIEVGLDIHRKIVRNVVILKMCIDMGIDNLQ